MILSPQAPTVSSLLPHLPLPACHHHLCHPILPAPCLGLCKRSMRKQQNSGESTRHGCQEKGWRRRGWSMWRARGAVLSSCAAHSPSQAVLQGAAGGIGEAETESLWRLEKKSQGFEAKMRPEQCDWSLWMNTFHRALPLPLNAVFSLSLSVSHLLVTAGRHASAVRRTVGQEDPKRIWDSLLLGQKMSHHSLL